MLVATSLMSLSAADVSLALRAFGLILLSAMHCTTVARFQTSTPSQMSADVSGKITPCCDKAFFPWRKP